MNERYHSNLKGWLDIAPHVFVWHYFVDFTHYLLPYPIWKTMARDLQLYRDLGVEGVLLQAGIGLGLYQEFQELKMHVFHKLLWDPDLVLESLVKEFVESYYGPASPEIMEFITNINASSESTLRPCVLIIVNDATLRSWQSSSPNLPRLRTSTPSSCST